MKANALVCLLLIVALASASCPTDYFLSAGDGAGGRTTDGEYDIYELDLSSTGAGTLRLEATYPSTTAVLMTSTCSEVCTAASGGECSTTKSASTYKIKVTAAGSGEQAYHFATRFIGVVAPATGKGMIISSGGPPPESDDEVFVFQEDYGGDSSSYSRDDEWAYSYTTDGSGELTKVTVRTDDGFKEITPDMWSDTEEEDGFFGDSQWNDDVPLTENLDGIITKFVPEASFNSNGRLTVASVSLLFGTFKCDWDTYFSIKNSISEVTGEMSVTEYGLWLTYIDAKKPADGACDDYRYEINRADNSAMAQWQDSVACSNQGSVTAAGYVNMYGAYQQECSRSPILSGSALADARESLDDCEWCKDKFEELEKKLFYLAYPEEELLETLDYIGYGFLGLGGVSTVGCALSWWAAGGTCWGAIIGFGGEMLITAYTSHQRMTKADERGEEFKAGMQAFIFGINIIPGASEAVEQGSKVFMKEAGEELLERFGKEAAQEITEKMAPDVVVSLAEKVRRGIISDETLGNLLKIAGVYDDDAVKAAIKFGEQVGFEKFFANGELVDQVAKNAGKISAVTSISDDVFEITLKNGDQIVVRDGVSEVVENVGEAALGSTLKRNEIIEGLVKGGKSYANAEKLVVEALENVQKRAPSLLDEFMDSMARHAHRIGFDEVLTPMLKGNADNLKGSLYQLRVADDLVEIFPGMTLKFEPRLGSTALNPDFVLTGGGKTIYAEAKNSVSSLTTGQIDRYLKYLAANEPTAELWVYVGKGQATNAANLIASSSVKGMMIDEGSTLFVQGVII